MPFDNVIFVYFISASAIWTRVCCFAPGKCSTFVKYLTFLLHLSKNCENTSLWEKNEILNWPSLSSSKFLGRGIPHGNQNWTLWIDSEFLFFWKIINLTREKLNHIFVTTYANSLAKETELMSKMFQNQNPSCFQIFHNDFTVLETGRVKEQI